RTRRRSPRADTRDQARLPPWASAPFCAVWTRTEALFRSRGGLCLDWASAPPFVLWGLVWVLVPSGVPHHRKYPRTGASPGSAVRWRWAAPLRLDTAP